MKMKKKPALQLILDNLHSYSVEELQSIPGQPLWIRQQLVKLRTERHAKQLEAKAIELAAMMPDKVNPGPVPLEVRQWQGDTSWLESKRSLQLEIHHGNLFYILDPTTHLILCEYSALEVADWNKFLAQTTSLGHFDRPTYIQMISDQKSKLIPDQIIDLTPKEGLGKLAGLGVTFK